MNQRLKSFKKHILKQKKEQHEVLYQHQQYRIIAEHEKNLLLLKKYIP